MISNWGNICVRALFTYFIYKLFEKQCEVDVRAFIKREECDLNLLIRPENYIYVIILEFTLIWLLHSMVPGWKQYDRKKFLGNWKVLFHISNNRQIITFYFFFYHYQSKMNISRRAMYIHIYIHIAWINPPKVKSTLWLTLNSQTLLSVGLL